MGPALQPYIFVGQGPRALPGVREITGRADVGIGPYESITRSAFGIGRATARVAPTQKFVLGRHTQKFLLTPGEKSDTLNAIQAMMGVAARSRGRKCPPDGTVMAVECGNFPNSGGTTDYDFSSP